MSMIGSKIGTKAWSEAPQTNNSRAEMLPGHDLTSAEMAKLGGDNIGDVANKVADPNWVDPSKKVRAVGNDKLDKDAFMKLMIAQMKNQDPTNPMQNHELAAQLAQFSSVEQLQNVNTTLEDMRKGQKPTESFQALNFIGKSVAGDSAKLVRAKGDKSHDFSFNLPMAAKEAVIKVLNQNGEVVRKVDLKDLKAGANNWVWNGLNEQAQAQPMGEYRFVVEALSSEDKKLAVKTDFEGLITGVNYTPEGPVLLVGNQSVKLKDVKKIVDPSLMKNGQIVKKSSSPDLKKQQTASQNEVSAKDKDVPAAGDDAPPQPANLNDAAMAQGMLNRLEKELKPDEKKPVAQAADTKRPSATVK
jgi:flagellar basal-body rod modification protein FlgD